MHQLRTSRALRGMEVTSTLGASSALRPHSRASATKDFCRLFGCGPDNLMLGELQSLDPVLPWW